MPKRSSLPLLPGAPVALIAVAVGGREVLLAWTEIRAGGLGFRIERADGIGSACRFSMIGEVGPHVAAFRDRPVKPRKTYSYRVLAWNATGNSLPSNVESVPVLPEAQLPAD